MQATYFNRSKKTRIFDCGLKTSFQHFKPVAQKREKTKEQILKENNRKTFDQIFILKRTLSKEVLMETLIKQQVPCRQLAILLNK